MSYLENSRSRFVDPNLEIKRKMTTISFDIIFLKLFAKGDFHVFITIKTEV